MAVLFVENKILGRGRRYCVEKALHLQQVDVHVNDECHLDYHFVTHASCHVDEKVAAVLMRHMDHDRMVLDTSRKAKLKIQSPCTQQMAAG